MKTDDWYVWLIMSQLHSILWGGTRPSNEPKDIGPNTDSCGTQHYSPFPHTITAECSVKTDAILWEGATRPSNEPNDIGPNTDPCGTQHYSPFSHAILSSVRSQLHSIPWEEALSQHNEPLRLDQGRKLCNSLKCNQYLSLKLKDMRKIWMRKDAWI